MTMYGLCALGLMGLSWGLSPKLAAPVMRLCVEGGTWGEWAASVVMNGILLLAFLAVVWWGELRKPLWTA